MRSRPSDDFLDSLDDMLDGQTAKKTNVAAMIALFSVTIGLFPAGIVFGLLGTYEISRRPDESGRYIAIAAVVVGLIELIAVVAITARLPRVQLTR